MRKPDPKVKTFAELVNLAFQKIHRDAFVLEEPDGNLIISTGLKLMPDDSLEVITAERTVDTIEKRERDFPDN